MLNLLNISYKQKNFLIIKKNVKKKILLSVYKRVDFPV